MQSWFRKACSPSTAQLPAVSQMDRWRGPQYWKNSCCVTKSPGFPDLQASEFPELVILRVAQGGFQSNGVQARALTKRGEFPERCATACSSPIGLRARPSVPEESLPRCRASELPGFQVPRPPSYQVSRTRNPRSITGRLSRGSHGTLARLKPCWQRTTENMRCSQPKVL